MNKDYLRLIPAGLLLVVLPVTHTVALRLACLFAASALAAWAWVRHPSDVRGPVPGLFWLVLWGLTPLLLLPFSTDIPYSAAEIKAEVAYGTLAFFTFYVLGCSERALRSCLVLVFSSALVLSAWVVVDRYRVGVWNEAGYFGGRVTFTAYLVTVAPLGLIIWTKRLFGAATPWLLAAHAGFALWIGFLSEQRGFWMAVACQVICFVGMQRGLGSSVESRRKTIIPAILLVGIAVVAVIAAGARFTHTSHLGALTEDPRLQHWGQVIAWIASEPLTGYGFGRGMMAKAFPSEVVSLGQFWHAHNVVLNYGFQLGVPGIVAIVGVFGSLLSTWLKTAQSVDSSVRAVAMAGVLIVVGVFVRNMTNDVFQRDLSLLFWSLMGLLIGYAGRIGKGA